MTDFQNTPDAPAAQTLTEIDGGAAVVVGAGLAGLFTALTLVRHHDRPVTLITLDRPGTEASSAWAQGGIAAAMGSDDMPLLHARDTVSAGAGTVDPAIARLVAEEAPRRIMDLVDLGIPFDRFADGSFSLGREAAHSRNRIVKVTGDRAGAVVTSTLARVAEQMDALRILPYCAVHGLVMEKGAAAGVEAVHVSGTRLLIRAPHVVLATGSAGGLYGITTTPLGLMGTGVGLAARAGATIGDPEFVQFHPTGMVLNRDPVPLATEALRGEGAILVTQTGHRFMPGIHDDAELAPRDVVARAIHARISAGDKVFLDCREAIGARFPDAFPTVNALCREAGIDPVREPIPVAPAAHYHMGGILTDDRGRTSIPGLWACGEVACTGLHGANRLASNSLAEAIVFGGRIGEAIGAESAACPALAPLPDHLTGNGSAKGARPALPLSRNPALSRLRQIMNRDVGLIRDGASLTRAAEQIARLAAALPDNPGAHRPGAAHLLHVQLANAVACASLIVAGAAQRTESRGGHFRSDAPTSDPAWARRTVITLDQARGVIHDLADGGASGGLLTAPANHGGRLR